jgi:hypothetical protein
MHYRIKQDLYHKKEIEEIQSINRIKSGKTFKANSYLNNIKAKLKPVNNKFEIICDYHLLSETLFEYDPEIINFISGNYSIVLEKIFITSQSIGRFSGHVNCFYSNNFIKSHPYYHKVFIPTEKKFDPYFRIEKAFFTSDLGVSSTLGTVALLDNETIYISSIKDKEKKEYLVIESSLKQSLETFQQKLYAVSISIGFVTGTYHADQAYFFCYTHPKKQNIKHFYFSSLRKSMSNGYNPTNSNPYGLISVNKGTAEKYKPLLRDISINEFSELVKRVFRSTDFAGVLLLMQEAASASLILMPGGFAIALETLVPLILAGSKSESTPLLSKNDKDEFLKGCFASLNSVLEGKKAEDMISYGLIKNRIRDLVQPTNSNKLQTPFTKLGIKLVAADIEALKYRNQFLHGHFPDVTKAGKKRSLMRLNLDLFYCSLRFYTLLNMLILKWIGYDNYIVNYPKLMEKTTGISLPDEEAYRKI